MYVGTCRQSYIIKTTFANILTFGRHPGDLRSVEPAQDGTEDNKHPDYADYRCEETADSEPCRHLFDKYPSQQTFYERLYQMWNNIHWVIIL